MKRKILVIDDEKAVCKMLEKFLVQQGHKPISALSGKEGLKKLQKEKPHIVLLDIRMPDMDGVETLKEIRKLDKRVGIIMITAVKKDAVGRECLKLGAYGYITKPFDFDYLERTLTIKLLDFAGEE